jgi:hypothetical protein
MSNYGVFNVEVVKQYTKVVIDKLDDRHKKFAEKYLDNLNSLEAYNFAYCDIQEVRASTMLKDPELWEVIFEKLKEKKEISNQENDWVNCYNKIKENLDLSPFEIFRIFVEKSKDSTLGATLNIDCIQAFQYLLFAAIFFKKIKREYFFKKTKEVMFNELAMIEVCSRETEKKLVINKARSLGFDFNELIE